MSDMPSPAGSEIEPSLVVEVAQVDSALAGSDTAAKALTPDTTIAPDMTVATAQSQTDSSETSDAQQKPRHFLGVDWRAAFNAALPIPGRDFSVPGSHQSGRWQ